jgi:GTP-binding protein
LKFLAYAPAVYVSAKTGQGLKQLFEAAERVHAASRMRVTTGQLNRVLAKAAEAYAPKAAKGDKPVRILFSTQIGVAPPTFLIAINHPVDLHFSYKRYLENQLRTAFGFEGAPIVLKVRTRKH